MKIDDLRSVVHQLYLDADIGHDCMSRRQIRDLESITSLAMTIVSIAERLDDTSRQLDQLDNHPHADRYKQMLAYTIAWREARESREAMEAAAKGAGQNAAIVAVMIREARP